MVPTHLLQARGALKHWSTGPAAGTAHLSGPSQTAHRVPAGTTRRRAMPGTAERGADGELPIAHWQAAPGSLSRASTWPERGPPEHPPTMQRSGSAVPPSAADARTEAQQGSKLRQRQGSGEARPVVPSRKLGKGASAPQKVCFLGPHNLRAQPCLARARSSLCSHAWSGHGAPSKKTYSLRHVRLRS